MREPSRRALLTSIPGGVLALAGCQRSDGDRAGSTATASERPPLPNSATDLRSVRLRRSSREPILWVGDRPDLEDDPESDPNFRTFVIVVDSTDRARELSYADLEGVDRVRSFLLGSDFGESSAVVVHLRIPLCRRLERCRTSWGNRRVELEYGSVLRDGTDDCSNDEYATVVDVIRLLDPIDHHPRNGTSLSLASAPCRPATTTAGGSSTTTGGEASRSAGRQSPASGG